MLIKMGPTQIWEFCALASRYGQRCWPASMVCLTRAGPCREPTRCFGDDAGWLAAGVVALLWTIVGWRGITRYRWGAPRCEVELNAGGGGTFLFAGQQGQRAGIGCGGTVRVQGAWPQPDVADCGDFGRVYQRLTD